MTTCCFWQSHSRPSGASCASAKRWSLTQQHCAPKKRTLQHPTPITATSYTVLLPTHKADRFYEGNKVMIPAHTDALNPIPIFTRYISARDARHGLKPFLWIHEDGSALTRSWFMAKLRSLFSSDIGGHSLRAGGATAYALAGVPDDCIQALGRWSSDTFKIYIRKTLPCCMHSSQGPGVNNTTSHPSQPA